MNISIKTGLIYLSLSVALGGCASDSSKPKTNDVAQEMQSTIDSANNAQQNQNQMPPTSIQSALLPPIQLNMPNTKQDAETRFDITVNGANANEFFMGLVEGTDYNMVVHPDVSGTITLSLKNVTIPEVLQTVNEVFGYSYTRNGHGFQIMPQELQTRIFQLSYINVKRTGTSQTTVSSGQISNGSNTNNTNDTSSTSSSSGNTSNNVGSTTPSSSIETSTEADFWTEFTTSMQAIIGDGNGRKIVVSPQTGVLVVRAMPNEIQDLEKFLQITQHSLYRQVIIEAKILEIQLSDGFQSGVNWSAIGEPKPGQKLVFGQTGGGTILNSGTSGIAGNTGTLDPSNLSNIEGTTAAAFGGVFSVAATLNDFAAFIELLETQGKVQVLSSPRVSTVNNQKAVIKVGTDEFFVTDISSDTTTGTASNTAQDITLTPFFSGIALDVTPQINEQGSIILHIHPSISEVNDQTKTITVNNQSQTLPLALSSIRETDSIVNTQSGQIIVIGGLMQTLSTDKNANVPGLGRIPLVGNLFKHKLNSTVKTELIVLLKAVVVDDNTWNQDIQNTSDRFNATQ